MASNPHRTASRPVALDLFAGAGGLSLGLEQAGFDVLCAVEYDPVHAVTHQFNFVNTEVLCADVAQLDIATLKQAVARGWRRHGLEGDWDGDIDLIAGGPPCQGFSWMGKRRVDDERNDLIFHYFRIVEALRPRYFVMENVPGMAAGEHGKLLDDLINKFQAAGYVVRPPKILNAAHFGVPQDRRRLILIGSRHDVPEASHPVAQYRPVRTVRPVEEQKQLPAGPTVGDALSGVPNLDDFEQLRHSDKAPLSEALLASLKAGASDYARRLMGIEPDPGDLSRPRVWDPSVLTSSRRTDHTARSVARFSQTPPGSVEPISRFLRLPLSGLCNTLRAGTGSERGAHTSPRPIHPIFPRVLSVREAARLHSYPDWFRFHATKWHGFRQIGNSVPPLLGRAIGNSITKALGAQISTPTTLLPLGDERLLSLSMGQAARDINASEAQMPARRRRQRELALAS